MKNSKFLVSAFMMLLTLTFTPNLFSTSITSMNLIPEQGSKVFMLSVETSGNGIIDIRIVDSNKRTYFSDQHKSLNSFTQKINLSDLSIGSYFIELEDESTINIQPLSITGAGISFDKVNSFKLFKPTIILDNQKRKLDVNWLMKEFCDGKLVLEEESGNIIFTEKVQNQLIIAKRFNISKLAKGTYYLTIENDKQSYKRTLKVE